MSFNVIATIPFERKLKRLVKKTVFLMDIYDKAEQVNITDKELQMLIDILAND